MEKLSSVLTDYILKSNAIQKESYDIYKYGFQTGMELLTCMLISFFISFQLNMVVENIVFLGIFILLRSYAGGLHLENFISCFLCSSIVQTGVLVVAKYFQMPIYVSVLIILIMLPIIKLLEPVNNINRPLDAKEQQYFSGKLKLILEAIAILTILLSILRFTYYLSLIAITIMVDIISIISGKWKYQKDTKKIKDAAEN